MSKKAAKKKAQPRQRKLRPAMKVESETVAASPIRRPYRPGSEPEYIAFLERQKFVFSQLGQSQLFTTDSGPDLFVLYLNNIAPDVRQHYNCHACRRFINAYGGLVTIEDDGTRIPVMWQLSSAAPDDIRLAIDRLHEAVASARVTGVFYSEFTQLGQPITGPWHHMAVQNQRPLEHAALSSEQAMAVKLEAFKNVQRALDDFSSDAVKTVYNILIAEALPQPEKFIRPAQFLIKMHEHRTVRDQRKRTALMWKEVAAAPEGFCHPRSSMIGTLLEDLKTMSFDLAKQRFTEKLHPLKYQRPQAAPAAGTLVQAEQLFEKMGLARALERRYATVHETPLNWSPADPADRAGHNTQSLSVFGHLTPKPLPTSAKQGSPPASVGFITMTWRKFQNIVLPMAIEIELLVPAQGPFHALTTAVHDDAPRILQWANPFSWYTYVKPSHADNWGLIAGRFTPVTGITSMPNEWEPGFEHHGKGVLFFLHGAKDRNTANICLFPALLRGELHGVRSVIEAHSQSRSLTYPRNAPIPTQLACGLAMRHGSQGGWGETIRVRTSTSVLDYQLDRWD